VYAADAAELLRALDAVPASVIGVSMGGGVALDLAMAHPELVDRLVLIAPGIGGWEWGEGMDAFDAAESAAVEAGDLDAASWLNVRFWLDGASRTPDELDAALRQRVFDMQRRAFDMDNPAAEGGWLVPDRHLRLRDVDHATLLLVGALDQPDFVQIARHMSERMPRARMQMLPGVAHLPPMEDPAGFLAAIREHLSS
jgi:pimeloyl-ACP methyl ester carboxylesterase